MKTQVFKNSESVKTSNFMMFVSMIIFAGILLFVSDNGQSLFWNGAINTQSKPVFFNNEQIINKIPETEFSLAKMQSYLIPETEPELTVSYANSIVFPDVEPIVLTADKEFNKDNFLKELQIQANEKTRDAVENYAFEKKIREYLTPENEPELEASDVISIVFPDVDPVTLTADNEFNKDNFLKDLQIQANEKTREAVEYYALEKKIRKYLTIETEPPLQLEDWMTNRKCWCPELPEAIALKEENKTTVKQ
jgi:hypothetical protein